MMDKDVTAVRDDLLNTVVFAFSLYGLLGLSASLLRILTIGWYSVFLVHLGVAIGMWALYLLRTRLAFPVRLWSLVALLSLTWSVGAVQLGLLGAWPLTLVCVPLLLTLLYGRRYGLLSVAVLCVYLLFIGYGFMAGFVPFDLIIQDYHVHFSSWFILVSSFIVVSISLVLPLDLTQKRMLANVATLHKQSRALEDSHQHLTQILEFLPVAVAVFDLSGSTLLVNQLFRDTFGYTVDEIPTADEWRLRAYPDPAYREEVTAFWKTAVMEALSRQKPASAFMRRITTKTGTVLRVEMAAKWIGEQLVVIFNDVTAQKRTEEAHREAVETLTKERLLLRAVIDNLPDAIYAKDLQGRKTLVNRVDLENIGAATFEEVLGKTDYELFEHDVAAHFDAADQYVFRTGEPLLNQEERLVNVHGREIILLSSKLPLRDADGQMVGLVGIGHDVTDFKQAEEALRVSEQRYRELFARISNGVAVYRALPGGEDFVFADFNRAAERIEGVSREEVLGKRVTEVFPAISEFGLFEIFRHVWQTGDPTHYPVAFYQDDRVAGWRENYVYKLPSGEIVSVYDDKTEQIQGEVALRRSEATLRSIFQVAPTGIGLAIDRGLVRVNDRVCEMTGYTREELVGQSMRVLYMSDEDYEAVCRGQDAQIRERGSAVLETRWACKDGQVMDVLLSSAPIDPHDASSGNTFTVLDMTERKQALDALRASEERLRQAQSIAHIGSWELDLLTERLDWSDEVYRIFEMQRTSETLPRDSFFQAVHPDDRERVRASYNRAVQERTLYSIVHRILLPDERVKYVYENCETYYDDDGQPLRSLGTVQDITERKQAEEERERLLAQIQDSEQRIRQIMDTVPEGVLLLDSDLRVMLCNPLAREYLALLGDKPSACATEGVLTLGGRSVRDLLVSPPRGLWHEIASTDCYFQVVARPLEIGPDMNGWVMVLHDVTEAREVERRTQRQERLAAVGQLAAGIAHDFNNILAAIMLYSQMSLRTPGLPPKLAERLGIIAEQGRRASDLIGQILDFSRSPVLDRHPLDLVPLLKEQVKLWKRTLPETIHLHFTYGADTYIITADLTRIQQVLMNLVLNARDAMPEGGELHIILERFQFTSRKDAPLPDLSPGAWVRMSISDSGTGIPPDVLPHIYDPFFTTKAPGKGTGLGLTQVLNIVTSHEGLLDLYTEEGKGTTFFIYLPALSDLEVIQSVALDRDLQLGHGEVIMVVEDSAMTREALTSTLSTLNYQILAAENGVQAMEIYKQQRESICLIISDWVMPDMGGKKLLEELQEYGLDVPVVVLSGHPLELGDLTTSKSQVAAWLQKPVGLVDLADVLRRFLKS